MKNKINFTYAPYFLENSIPITYYKYKSVVRDTFFTIKYTNIGIQDEFISKNTEDTSLYYWLLTMYLKIENDNKDIYFDTNKIVFEMQTESKSKFFLGWYDGHITLGLKRDGDKYIQPIKIKYT